MTTLAKAYVQIVPSAEGIKGSITNVLNGESKNAGSIAGTNIVGSLKKIIVGAGLGKVLTDTLMEGANLQQSIGGIETLFKESSDKVKKYAQEAYKTAGVSANTYMQQVTSFSASLISSLGGDTTKATEYANRAIVDMADNANKMGTDMESIQNAYQGFAKQNYTMLDNLKLGYGGTKEEMARLIAEASKMTAAQEELGITVDASNMSFDNIVNAISVVQTNLGIAGATSEEAAKTLSGSFASMQSAAKNFLGNLVLGEDIVPALTSVVETTSTFLFANLIPVIWNIITSIPVVMAEGIPLIVTEAKNMILNMIDSMRNQFPNVLKSGTDSIITFIQGMLNDLPSLLSTGGDLIAQLVEAFMSMLPHISESASRIVVSLITGIIQNFPRIVEVGLSLIGNIAAGIINGIPDLVTKSLTIFSKVKSAFTNLDWLSIGRNIINGIKNGISGAVNSLIQTARNAASSALNSVKSFLGIHSPSKVFDTEVGKMISLGLAEGIEGNLKPVTNAMNALSDETIGAINTDFSVASVTPQTVNYNNFDYEKMAELFSNVLKHLKIELDQDVVGRVLDDRLMEVF